MSSLSLQKSKADRFGITLIHEKRVILHVSNTLAGSASPDIDSVFEPSYRMDARTASGSGLGLYVVKLLCDRLGWTVGAELNGNTFVVSIMI